MPLKKSETRVAFEAIGTQWVIDSTNSNSASIQQKIAEFDQNYSRFREDSWVMQVGNKPDVYVLPPNAQPMFDLYFELYGITGGKFTPLIGKTLEEAGYDSLYSFTPKTLHTPPIWDMALDYNFPKLTIKQPVILDFGAMGKGYLIDLVSKLCGTSFCIDAGGDILAKNKPLRIGLENPLDFSQVVGVANLNNQSICASAGNRRRWDKFHHILDPQLLASPTNILATWVTAKTAMLADALATCLFFTSAQTLQKRYKFEYLLINSDRTFEKSANFPAKMFSNALHR